MKEEHKSNQPIEKRKRFTINRRLYIVLVCFFIAIIFWFLLALSRDYPATVTFPITYTNLPDKKIIVNDLPDSIALQIKAKGFRIMAYKLSTRRKVLEIDVASRLQSGRSLQGEVLAVPTRVFAPDFIRQFGPDIAIFGYQPDSIVFYFSELVTKKLPVQLRMNIQYDKQYDASEELIISPDSIEVSGPPSVVNNLTMVETEVLNLTGVKTEIRQEVSIKKNKLLSYKKDKVNLIGPVEKYTEGIMSARIKVIKVPPGCTLKTFPDRVDVRYLVALSNYNKIEEHMFELVVNGEFADTKHPDKLKLELVRFPSLIRSPALDPDKVDYILRKQ